MVKIKQPRSPLQKLIKRGFKGYPVATVAYYGPTNKRATKVAVGIVPAEEAEATALERWHLPEGDQAGDIRRDRQVEQAILSFLKEQEARTVFGKPGLMGCPHEEGIDYPEGESCPHCPYWEGKDRLKIADLGEE